MSSILNTELEDEIQSLEDERALSNEYFSELQAEFEAEKQALVARVEGLQNTAALNTTAKIELDSLQMKLEESEREKASLEEKFYSWREKYASLESDVARLQNELVSAAEEKRQFEEMWTAASEEGSMRNKELEIQVKGNQTGSFSRLAFGASGKGELKIKGNFLVPRATSLPG